MPKPAPKPAPKKGAGKGGQAAEDAEKKKPNAAGKDGEAGEQPECGKKRGAGALPIEDGKSDSKKNKVDVAAQLRARIEQLKKQKEEGPLPQQPCEKPRRLGWQPRVQDSEWQSCEQDHVTSWGFETSRVQAQTGQQHRSLPSSSILNCSSRCVSISTKWSAQGAGEVPCFDAGWRLCAVFRLRRSGLTKCQQEYCTHEMMISVSCLCMLKFGSHMEQVLWCCDSEVTQPVFWSWPQPSAIP